MIDPWAFVRGVTLVLATTWTVTGLVRTWRFAKRWHARLAWLGLEDPWWRRQVATAVLRATVLDPLNLALVCLLLGLWSLRLAG